MLSDIFGQAVEAMRHNRRRTMITVVGMAWGIATVVLLLAYGAGFGQAFENIFAQWGTNMIGVFPGRTSEQAGGEKAGVKVRLTMDDVERIQETVPGILRVAPTVDKTVPVQNELHSFTWDVTGITPELQSIQKMELAEGRLLTQDDVQQRAHVVIIGSEAKTKLFSGLYAIGQKIRLNGVSFEIVGILGPKMQEGDNSDINRVVNVPFTTMGDIKDTKYLDGIWMDYKGQPKAVEQALRKTLAAAHNYRPYGPARGVRREHHGAADAVPNHLAGTAGAAAVYRSTDAGHRGYRTDEHHAGERAAENARDRSGEGTGRAEAAYSVAVSGRGAGDLRPRRSGRHRAGLRGRENRRQDHVL